MAGDKPKTAQKGGAKPKAAEAKGYVVAVGKSLCVPGMILVEGQAITADQVADIEALVKGGYVVKA